LLASKILSGSDDVYSEVSDSSINLSL